jgi:L-methionine (R)-S-oxide reductase
MAESLMLPETTLRSDIYAAILPQIEVLVNDEPDFTANLANIVAVLKEAFGFFWVGFYVTKGENLVLAPFQGPIACTRIAFNRGVCGHCYTTRQTVIVPDVDLFPGHIACASASKSEIVLPAFDAHGRVILVLDVDSDKRDDFSQTDAEGLEKIMRIVEKCYAQQAL